MAWFRAPSATSRPMPSRPARRFPWAWMASRGVRHAPTLINRAWGKSQFWDGRAPTLEAQIIVPITNPDEMGMTTDGVVAEDSRHQRLRAAFRRGLRRQYHYLRSYYESDCHLRANHRFGKLRLTTATVAGDKKALTKQQKDGLDFFNKKGECAECHSGPELYRREICQHRRGHGSRQSRSRPLRRYQEAR